VGKQSRSLHSPRRRGLNVEPDVREHFSISLEIALLCIKITFGFIRLG